jgi:multiple sugar transport system permease protein
MADARSVASVGINQQYLPMARRSPITRLLEDVRRLALCLMLPTILVLSFFIAHPLFNGILLAVTDTKVGAPGRFVGMDNFAKIWSDDIFHIAVCNTCLYTFITNVFKLGLGLWLALLLNLKFRGKPLMRAFILLPFIIPTVLSTFAWKWMFHPTFSVLLYHVGTIDTWINWGKLMAGALLGSISVAFVYSFSVEYYVSGITGSVKGEAHGPRRNAELE